MTFGTTAIAFALVWLIGLGTGFYIGFIFVKGRLLRHHLSLGMSMKAAQYATNQTISGPRRMGDP